MTLTVKGIDAISKDFHKFAMIYPTAVRNSMNTALSAGMTASLARDGGMRQEWVGITARDLKRHTYTRKATVSKHHAQFVVTSNPIDLYMFGAKQNTRGVSYKLKNKRRTMRKSWITPSKFGRRENQVFVRQASNDDRVTRRASITPTSMFLEADSGEVFEKYYKGVFRRRWNDQLKFLMS